MVEYFCSKLPGDISRPMYNEYHDRMKVIKYIIRNRSSYSILSDDLKSIEIIVALSVFYKRVIANINGAVIFASAVFKYSEAESVEIGSYKLTQKEKNRILAVIISYKELIERYELSNDLITTTETKDLLRKIKNLKIRLEEGSEDKPNQNEPF